MNASEPKNYDVPFNCRVLRSYAQLQIDCIELAESLIEIGTMDCRLGHLPGLYQQFVLKEELLIRDGLISKEICILQDLSGQFAHLCKKLAEFGIPATLEHGDFHDNNILVKDGNITLNDFGDAAITHPFFSCFLSIE